MSRARLVVPVVAAFGLGVVVGGTFLGHGLPGGADNSGASSAAAGSSLSVSGGPSPSIASSPASSTSSSPGVGSPSPTPPAVLVALPTLSVKVAGATSLKYFDVEGDSPNALLLAATTSPKGCQQSRVLGCARLYWHADWNDRTSGTSCRVTSVTYTYTANVTFPRFVRPARVYPELVTWWKAVIAHVERHLEADINLVKADLAKARQEILSGSCATEQATFQRWDKRIKTALIQSGTKDAAWSYPAYAGPNGWNGGG
jgi:predicted secreted Zn-dependent protease